MLITESGQRKTAILHNAFARLRSVNGQRWNDYQQELQQWLMQSENKKKRDGCKPNEPHSLIINDITVGKL